LGRLEARALAEALHDRFTEGKILTPHLINYVRTMWGNTLADVFEEERERIKETHIGTGDYLQIPRTLMASGDISRSFRQNITTIGQYKLFSKAMARDWSMFVKDEQTAKAMQNSRLLTESGQEALRYGLRINATGAGFKRGAERFAATRIKWLKKVPLLARSENAYVYGGNIHRLELFNHFYNHLKQNGIATEKNLRDLAHVVNILTGEGDPKTFRNFAQFLNAAFFAPRLLEARVRSFTDIFNPNLSLAVRHILAWEMTKFAMTNAGLLVAISQVPGVDVEPDPRSSDFGKLVSLEELQLSHSQSSLSLANSTCNCSVIFFLKTGLMRMLNIFMKDLKRILEYMVRRVCSPLSSMRHFTSTTLYFPLRCIASP